MFSPCVGSPFTRVAPHTSSTPYGASPKSSFTSLPTFQWSTTTRALKPVCPHIAITSYDTSSPHGPNGRGGGGGEAKHWLPPYETVPAPPKWPLNEQPTSRAVDGSAPSSNESWPSTSLWWPFTVPQPACGEEARVRERPTPRRNYSEQFAHCSSDCTVGPRSTSTRLPSTHCGTTM